jgi:hypothetical protein
MMNSSRMLEPPSLLDFGFVDMTSTLLLMSGPARALNKAGSGIPALQFVGTIRPYTYRSRFRSRKLKSRLNKSG